MFILKDDQHSAYQELHRREVTGAAVEKGDAVVINDVLCFWFTDGAVGDEVVPVWEARQVLADKKTGTGEEIEEGMQVYYEVATELVTANPSGAIGTDYYFCGICKDDAAADDDTVLMSFWGDEYNHADRA